MERGKNLKWGDLVFYGGLDNPVETMVYTNQYWHFQRVPSKLNHRIQKLFSKYISHNDDTFRELLPNNIDLFRTHIKQYSHLHRIFESLNGHLNREKIFKRKMLNWKWEKLAYTHPSPWLQDMKKTFSPTKKTKILGWRMREGEVYTKKSPPPKVPIPIQNSNVT